MQKYLLNMRVDVADEGYATLLTVINEETYKKIKKSTVIVYLCQMENDPIPFEDLELQSGAYIQVTPITDAEVELLERLNVSAHSGSFNFLDENEEDIDVY